MAKRPKVVWANGINLVGLYSSKPVRCVWKEPGDSTGAWWDASGDFDVNRLGFEFGPMDVFASASKRDVEMWTAGALAILSRLRELTEIAK